MEIKNVMHLGMAHRVETEAALYLRLFNPRSSEPDWFTPRMDPHGFDLVGDQMLWDELEKAFQATSHAKEAWELADGQDRAVS